MMLKTCSKCGVEKALAEFNRDKSRTDGHDPRCKACDAERNREYRAKHSERIAAHNKAWREQNAQRLTDQRRARYAADPEKYRERAARDRAADPEKHRERQRAARAADPERFRGYDRVRDPVKRREQKREYYAANVERGAEYGRKWRAENAEHIAEQKRKYAAANPHIDLAARAKRRAAKLQRTPAWTDLAALKAKYKLAADLAQIVGPSVVANDHILPLRGDKVSGLHVAENLQLMHRSDNSAKRNRITRAELDLVAQQHMAWLRERGLAL